MASRENQGLQIALILSVMLTVGLAVATFFLYQSANGNAKQKAAADDTVKSTQAALTKSQFQVQALKFMIEGGTDIKLEDIPTDDEDIKRIKDGFVQNMQLHAAGANEQERNYSSLPGFLVGTLQKQNETIATLQQQDQQNNAELTRVKDSEAKATAEALAKADEFKQKMDEAVSALEAERKANASKQAELQGQLQQSARQFAAQLKQEQTKVADLGGRLAVIERLNRTLKEKVELCEGVSDFKTPDGVVTLVDQRLRRAWINRGSADGLREQTTFSVYSNGVDGIETANKKAELEVSEVTGEHMAEARIIDDSISNPIVPGDVIYSPVWQAGRRLGFALTGILDVDDDGEEDRILLKNLITMSGGEIRAEATLDGRIEGELDADTRYLVTGKPPVSDKYQKGLASHTQMSKRAAELGVRELSLSEFLEFMGWSGATKTVDLRPGANPDDFQPEFNPRPFTADTPGTFRPRRGPKVKTNRPFESQTPGRGKYGAFN